MEPVRNKEGPVWFSAILLLFLLIGGAFMFLIPSLRKEPDTEIEVSYVDDKTCSLKVEGADFFRVRYALSELITLGHKIADEIIIPISSLEEFEETLADFRVNLILDVRVAKLLEGWRNLCNSLEASKEREHKTKTKLKLMRYQLQGVNYLREAILNARPYIKGALLGDPVGLGKTAQAIAAASSLKPEHIQKILVVCPGGLRYNWRKEIEKVIGEQAAIAYGNFETREEAYKAWDVETSWLVCSYDSVKRPADLDILEERVKQGTLLILDEAQSVKNWSSQRSRAVRKLARKSFGCIPMSATFIENNLGELYNIVTLVSRDILGGVKTKFLDRYTNKDSYGNIVGYKRLEEVKNKLAPFLLRRRKSDVKEQMKGAIPEEVIYTDYWVELSPPQRRIYNKLIEETVKLDTGKELNVTNALTRLSLRRQVCLFPELVGGTGQSTKAQALMEIVESFEPETKILIFTFYIGAAKRISQMLTEAGIRNVAATGDDREIAPELVDVFEKDDSVRVMIANDFMKAGHNLQMAGAVINFDLLWNPQSLRQREGRIDRIGQHSKVITVTNIITEGTVEELMWEVVGGKEHLFDEVIEAGIIEPRFTRRNMEDILNREKELFRR